MARCGFQSSKLRGIPGHGGSPVISDLQSFLVRGPDDNPCRACHACTSKFCESLFGSNILSWLSRLMLHEKICPRYGAVLLQKTCRCLTFPCSTLFFSAGSMFALYSQGACAQSSAREEHDLRKSRISRGRYGSFNPTYSIFQSRFGRHQCHP